METQSKNVKVVGAGLVGSLLSIFLSKRGHQVEVFERRSDYRKHGAIGGKSINLALSDRGWKALEAAGIAEDIKKIALPMYGRLMHDREGQLTYQSYGKEDQAIFSVSRGELNTKLLSLADERENVSIRFDEKCTEVDLRKNFFKTVNTESQEESSHDFDYIIGTDGAFSEVRFAMQKAKRFNYSQHYIEHSYKELEIPAAEGGGFRLRDDVLHIWPRGGFMLIALPNADGSFTCTLFAEHEGSENSFAALDTDEKIMAFMNREFADAVPHMPTLLEDFKNNPTSSLVTVRCDPWSTSDNALLLGDAAHAVVPFYGQGMNCGFEDCTVFEAALDLFEGDLSKAINKIAVERPVDANAIADLALYNFIEMRDSVAKEDFLLIKKIEARIYEQFPDKWIPLYSMVTFSHIPYSEAERRGKIQSEIMQELISDPIFRSQWDTLRLEDYIDFNRIK